MDEEGHPTLATALRGLLYTELRAKGPAVDLHSGTYGGVAPNPINTLARIVGELKDRNGHILKVDLFASKCSDYQNPQSLRQKLQSDPSFYKDCAARLGPNQPGVTTPDPTASGASNLGPTSADLGRPRQGGARAPGRPARRPPWRPPAGRAQ